MSYYVHHLPGRLRVKIPKLRNHQGRARRVGDLLAAQDGVTGVTVNPLTGSVLVNYDSDLLDEERILSVSRCNDLFDDRRVVRPEDRVDRMAARAGDAMGRALLSWAVGRALEARGLSLLAAFI